MIFMSLKTTKNRLAASVTTAAVMAVLAAAAPVQAQEDPKLRVDRVVAEVIAVLSNQGLSETAKRDQIETIAVANFDFPTITRLVLARNYKKLTPEQREAFMVEFKRHLSLTYGRRVDAYSDQKVDIGDSKAHSNGDVTVNTTIVGGTVDGVVVAYRLRQKDGSWQAIDVIVEGVSMISNFRSQIQEIVSSKGADQLIETLRAKNDKEASEGTTG